MPRGANPFSRGRQCAVAKIHEIGDRGRGLPPTASSPTPSGFTDRGFTPTPSSRFTASSLIAHCGRADYHHDQRCRVAFRNHWRRRSAAAREVLRASTKRAWLGACFSLARQRAKCVPIVAHSVQSWPIQCPPRVSWLLSGIHVQQRRIGRFVWAGWAGSPCDADMPIGVPLAPGRRRDRGASRLR
jgi:hypothetical protein